MSASAETIGAVRVALLATATAYSAKDVRAVLDAMSNGPSDVMIGTGADEWRVGPAAIRAQVERDFAQAEALAFEYRDLMVDGTDDVAWFAAKATVNATVGGTALASPVRFSGVIARRGGAWKFVQWHLSVPAAGQEEGSSF